jgi:hypothetical protein
MNLNRALWSKLFPALGLLSGVLLFSSASLQNNVYSLRLGRLKYQGGGDWYSSRTALTNLATYCNQKLGTSIDPNEGVADIGGPDLFNYPFIFMTGHGNVVFSETEAQNLRLYLESGGFLHICDNYGLDKFVRPQMKKVFPELDFKEIPHNHPIYQTPFLFPAGLPKVHQHDGKPPQGFGLFFEGRLVCFYDYESDLGNGWEDQEVYNDPPEIRQKALQMGANMLYYIFQH